VAAHVRELMADRAQWTGSASDLLLAGTNRPGWPKSARALAGRLRRAQTFLRTLKVEIAFGREGRLGTRTIRITASGESRTHNLQVGPRSGFPIIPEAASPGGYRAGNLNCITPVE